VVTKSLSLFWQAVFLLVSTIVGLGVFLLPAAAVASGIYFWLWFFILIGVIFLLHLVYGEIIFSVGEKHNLPGLVARLINPKFKPLVWLIDFIWIELIVLLYLVALAKFVPLILPIEPFLVKLAMAIFAAIIAGLSLNPFAKIEAVLSFLLIALFAVISLSLASQMRFENLTVSATSPLFAYGILLFSFAGFSALPLVYDLIGQNTTVFRRVNLAALLIVAFIYILFTLTMVGAFGQTVSEESLTSLSTSAPKFFLVIAVILAVLNIITTFISIVFYLIRGLADDFKLRHSMAWALIVLPVFIFVFLPIERLADLADIVGSVFIGLHLVFLLWCYIRLPRIRYFGIPKTIAWLLILLFFLGILQSVFFLKI
jgi:amino acid permease